MRQSEFSAAQEEYEKIFTDITNADQNLRKLNEELMEKRLSMEQSSGAKQLYEQKISFLRGQVERAVKEIEDNEKLIADSSATVSDNKNALKEEKDLLKTLREKADKISRQLLTVSEKIALGEELADANRKKIIESIESLSDIKLNKGTMSIEKNNLTDKLNELSEKLDVLSVKRESLFNDKERADNGIDELDRSVFDLKNQIEEKENEVRSGNEEVAKYDNAIYSLNSVITTLATKDNFYRGLKDNYEGYAPAVKNLLNKAKENSELKKRIRGVVAELIKSDKKYDVALETALAAAAQNVVTLNPDDARYLIEFLKINKLGRITFLPITSVKPREQSPQVTSALNEKGALGVANKLVTYDSQYENVISNLLGNTLIVDTLENATRIADKYRFAFKMVTLDGDVFTTQGAMTGGSRRTDTVGILSSDRKIEDNAEQLKIKREEMDKLKADKAMREKQRDRALDELSILNDLYTEKRQQILVEREKQSVAEKSLSEVCREIESTTDLIDELKEKLIKLDADFELASRGGKKLEEDKESATSTADKHQAEYDALRKQRDNLVEESTELQVRITETSAKITSFTAENERLNAVIRESQENVKGLTKSNANAEEIIEELRREQEKVALTKAEQDYINGIRTKIDNVENDKSELREKLNRNNEKKERITEELNSLSEKKHAEEIALAKIDSDLEYLQQSIWEDYQETYETAVKVKEEGYDEVQGEQEIARLRKRRSSLGAINATAIDDFKALKERYEEMNMQKDDLEKAEADLKEAIDKIKGEMLTQFDEGFTKINENFQRIFKELFGGGRAMLQIDYTDVEDRLEAGIEIVAEPPGKKLQKLSLLSGGEKALTAIAILFAILRLRPMPFCVLDEIEAALDEANVDRFARYLQKFSEDTQFIVITHRKPTMEMADALFGVTMQEKGVSKMVSVKLSDVADITGDTITN